MYSVCSIILCTVYTLLQYVQYYSVYSIEFMYSNTICTVCTVCTVRTIRTVCTVFTNAQCAEYIEYVQYVEYVHYAHYIQYAQYAQCEQLNLCYTAHITLLLSNQSVHLQITDTADQQTSVPSAARSTDCVDIARGSVLPVAQWTWYVHVVCCSGHTARTSGKCSLLYVLPSERSSMYYWNDKICDQLSNCWLLKKHSARWRSLAVYSPLRDILFT